MPHVVFISSSPSPSPCVDLTLLCTLCPNRSHTAQTSPSKEPHEGTSRVKCAVVCMYVMYVCMYVCCAHSVWQLRVLETTGGSQWVTRQCMARGCMHRCYTTLFFLKFVPGKGKKKDICTEQYLTIERSNLKELGFFNPECCRR